MVDDRRSDRDAHEPRAGSDSVRAVRTLVDRGEVDVVVSDLDGVLRVFDDGLWDRLDQELGADPGTSFAAILGHPVLADVIRGRAGHARWRELAVEHLSSVGTDPGRADAAVREWADTPAVVDQAVLTLLTGARELGLPVFVFTNGTDRVREEIEALGLGTLIGEGGRFLLNSADLGHAKPEHAAFRLAQQRVHDVIGREVDPARVLFLDDSCGHVRAAQQFGWRALHHG